MGGRGSSSISFISVPGAEQVSTRTRAALRSVSHLPCMTPRARPRPSIHPPGMVEAGIPTQERGDPHQCPTTSSRCFVHLSILIAAPQLSRKAAPACLPPSQHSQRSAGANTGPRVLGRAREEGGEGGSRRG